MLYLFFIYQFGQVVEVSYLLAGVFPHIVPFLINCSAPQKENKIKSKENKNIKDFNKIL